MLAQLAANWRRSRELPDAFVVARLQLARDRRKTYGLLELAGRDPGGERGGLRPPARLNTATTIVRPAPKRTLAMAAMIG